MKTEATLHMHTRVTLAKKPQYITIRTRGGRPMTISFNRAGLSLKHGNEPRRKGRWTVDLSWGRLARILTEAT
jgi:hypothetical protein